MLTVELDFSPDPVQVERELAHEIVHEEVAVGGSQEGTISYEEAMEREIEYQKRVKSRILQPPIGSGLPPAPSQVLSPKPSLVGVKRTAPEGFCEKRLPPKQLKDQQNPSQLLSIQQPSPQQLHSHQPLLQQLQHRKPSPQYLHFQQHPLPQYLNLQQPVLNHKPSFWCNFCKVGCTSAGNLQLHFDGALHKAKSDEVFGRKKERMLIMNKVLLCNVCNIPCTDGKSLAQHRAGKKHAARLQALGAMKVAAGVGVAKVAARSGCERQAMSVRRVENCGSSKPELDDFK